MRHRTVTGDLPLTTRVPLPISRDRNGLLAALDVIDDEGWDSPTATALLTYVRTEMVRRDCPISGVSAVRRLS